MARAQDVEQGCGVARATRDARRVGGLEELFRRRDVRARRRRGHGRVHAGARLGRVGRSRARRVRGRQRDRRARPRLARRERARRQRSARIAHLHAAVLDGHADGARAARHDEARSDVDDVHAARVHDEATARHMNDVELGRALFERDLHDARVEALESHAAAFAEPHVRAVGERHRAGLVVLHDGRAAIERRPPRHEERRGRGRSRHDRHGGEAPPPDARRAHVAAEGPRANALPQVRLARVVDVRRDVGGEIARRGKLARRHGFRPSIARARAASEDAASRFAVESETSSRSATSSCERPSTRRRTSAMRSRAGSASMIA